MLLLQRMNMGGRENDGHPRAKLRQAAQGWPFNQLAAEGRSANARDSDEHSFEGLRRRDEGKPDEVAWPQLANLDAEFHVINALLAADFLDVLDLDGVWHNR